MNAARNEDDSARISRPLVAGFAVHAGNGQRPERLEVPQAVHLPVVNPGTKYVCKKIIKIIIIIIY